MHILIAALHRPTKPTGVCRHAANLAKCLADNKKISQVTLVLGLWQKDYFKTAFPLCSEKINIIFVDIKNSSFYRNIWFLFGLPKLAEKINCDRVHLSFPLPFIRKLFPCPVIATIHDLYPYECPDNFGYPNVIFNQLFLHQCIQGSDALACVSQQTFDSLIKHFPYITKKNNQTKVVYNYVDFADVNIKLPDNLNNILDFPFLLSVAQHRKNKNLDILIQAYSLLLQQNQLPDSTKLIIVGSSGPETENIQSLIQALNLQEQVILVSSIDDRELCWLYKICELFIIPSSNEGFCFPLLEALSLSCKVVCSDIPILREVGSSKCYYFDLKYEPIKNIAESIIDALAQPPTNTPFMDTRFLKSKIAEQYLDIYQLIG
ncbi:glycosyltransferase family 4 protein [Calothrix sp. 336/3]|uniref:glycosyltransferase family 4 protein n=1 Tax=Calothrix sp. 336/3 TaxID=1337936 RepID=UPI0004E4345E|nr:glycosyltransferase family 1 protein [Calothrix sp. 336/3]AKG20944.1 mannosyltransferase B [Calothrix sp. 336/3]